MANLSSVTTNPLLIWSLMVLHCMDQVEFYHQHVCSSFAVSLYLVCQHSLAVILFTGTSPSCAYMYSDFGKIVCIPRSATSHTTHISFIIWSSLSSRGHPCCRSFSFWSFKCFVTFSVTQEQKLLQYVANMICHQSFLGSCHVIYSRVKVIVQPNLSCQVYSSLWICKNVTGRPNCYS